MTCKDCLSNTVCTLSPIRGKYSNVNIEDICEFFKNKADFVEAIRCKDCKYYESNTDHSGNGYEAEGYCNWFDCGVGGIDFCSYGERRADNDV